MKPELSEFQKYSKNRILNCFPEWKSLEKEFCEDGMIEIIYRLISPKNSENKLWVSLRSEDIMVTFSFRGSHEHYDIDDYLEENLEKKYDLAYTAAMNEYIMPVIENKLKIIRFKDSWFQGTLTSDVEKFLEANPSYEVISTETWK